MTVFTQTNIVSNQVPEPQCVEFSVKWDFLRQTLKLLPGAFHFLLPIRAISSAFAAALVLMSWFLARSMRTLRMLVGTSRDRANRDPCCALFGTWEAGRGARARLSTLWCSDRSNEFNTPLRFRMSTASTSLSVSSSSLARTGLLLWLWIVKGNSRARQKHAHTLTMVSTVCRERRGKLVQNYTTVTLHSVFACIRNFPTISQWPFITDFILKPHLTHKWQWRKKISFFLWWDFLCSVGSNTTAKQWIRVDLEWNNIY